jgi:hypothetical protein
MAFVFSFRVQNNIDFGPPRRGQINLPEPNSEKMLQQRQ